MMSDITRILTLVGDPNNVRTRGGTTYFLLKAGQEKGFINFGLPLDSEKLRFERYIWNLVTLLITGETGGFQYSDFFLKRLFCQVQLPTDSEIIEFISYFPLLPPQPWQDNWQLNYYIDATLKQNFEDYGYKLRVGKKIREKALQREYDHYVRAERIIGRSHWAANSVIKDYGISPSKVHVIPGGANLNEDLLQDIDIKQSQVISMKPFRLGFMGKDWQRKGLPFILKIADILHKREVQIEVLVMGPQPEELPSHPLIKSLGFIDKLKDMKLFIEVVQSFHFGCLFSSVEGFGFSNVECLRLGVPVIAANSCGIPDTVAEGLGFLFELDCPPSQVADFLEPFARDSSKYYQLRRQVIKRSQEFSWQRTVEKFVKVWQGSQEFIYE